MPADVRKVQMKITEVTKKNGTTVYRANIYLGVDSLTGKKVKTSITARTKTELKKKVSLAQFDFKENGSTKVKHTNLVTYAELAEMWWESYHHTVKPNTQDSVKRLLANHVIPLFGKYKLDKLSTPLIQSIINKLTLQANRGDQGAFLHYDKIHGINKRILQYGVVMQILDTNPAREVILPRKVKKESSKIKHFNNLELKTFLDYLDNLDTNRYRNAYETTLYKFLLATGCRINEALALHWSDIDFNYSTVNITKTLNHLGKINSPKSEASYRTIDIDPQTVTLLKHYQKRQTQEAWKLGRTETVVFSDFIHEYPNNKTLSTRLNTRFKHAGVPNIGFHGFRHTHASLLLNSGIPYKELQHRLGHSTLSMTMDTYSHLSRENAKKAVSFYEKAVNSL